MICIVVYVFHRLPYICFFKKQNEKYYLQTDKVLRRGFPKISKMDMNTFIIFSSKHGYQNVGF